MKVHFIGIGGIGVSALARFYLVKKWKVSGSDLTDSEINEGLRPASALKSCGEAQQAKALIFISHKSEHITADINKVIYTAAVHFDNPELTRARELNIPTYTYAEALGEITKDYFTICVSGSHGKSTTTALLSLMLIKADLDPTIIIGTRLQELGGTNFRLGQSKYLIIEADEWNNSFHHYHPRIVVLTNIDKEHLDTHKDLAGVIKNFNIYLQRVSQEGSIIINAQDQNSLAALKNLHAQIIQYNIRKSDFRIWPLQIAGEHNQLNCQAAWQAAQLLGVSHQTAEEAIKNYQGSWRRLEELKPSSNFLQATSYKLQAIFYSDYAHHPTEIKATAQALREKHPDKKLICIFQPHQVERLTNLFKEFTTCFTDFDTVGILPVYEVAGRERNQILPEQVEGLPLVKTSEDLVATLLASHRPQSEVGSSVFYLENFKKSFDLIQNDSVIVFMGAGDIDKEVRKWFKSKLLISKNR